MKVNRIRSIAKKNMRAVGNTTNRPEQLLAAALIEAHLPVWASVETEWKVRVNNPDTTEDYPKEYKLDIAVKIEQKKVAIELNGPPHDEKNAMRRDYRKKLILEWKGNDWKYVEFVYTKMPFLFLRNQKHLTIFEAEAVFYEIRDALTGILLLGPINHKMIESVLRKTQLNDSDQVS